MSPNRFVLVLFFLFPCFLGCIQCQSLSSYTLLEFNSDTCCWRKLAAEGRYFEAGRLIEFYKEAHPTVNRHALHWHAGQMFASAGDVTLATRYMKKSYNVLYPLLGGRDARAWYRYARGTVAFLHQDRRSFEKCLQRIPRSRGHHRNDDKLRDMDLNWGRSYLAVMMETP